MGDAGRWGVSLGNGAPVLLKAVRDKVGPQQRAALERELAKVVKFIVASHLSKYLQSAKYFDNDLAAYKATCEETCAAQFEKHKSMAAGYATRRVQQAVLQAAQRAAEEVGRSKADALEPPRKRSRVGRDSEAVLRTPPSRATAVGDAEVHTNDASTDAAELVASQPAPVEPLEVEISSQVSRTRNGVRMDYGFNDEQADDDEDADDADGGKDTEEGGGGGGDDAPKTGE